MHQVSLCCHTDQDFELRPSALLVIRLLPKQLNRQEAGKNSSKSAYQDPVAREIQKNIDAGIQLPHSTLCNGPTPLLRRGL